MEREIVLPSDVVAAPGRLRLTKPQRGVAEALNDPALERVSIMKSARVGASSDWHRTRRAFSALLVTRKRVYQVTFSSSSLRPA
jgi:hypothetical protein